MTEGYGTQVKKALLVALPLVLVLTLVSFLVPRHETTKLKSAKAFDCIDAPASSVVTSLRKRHCDQPHTAEVYAVFHYPGKPAPGMPTPDQNCHAYPDGLTSQDLALYTKLLLAIARPGVAQTLVTNNANPTKDRDYVCLVTFPARTGSYLEEALGQG